MNVFIYNHEAIATTEYYLKERNLTLTSDKQGGTFCSLSFLRHFLFMGMGYYNMSVCDVCI